jgi:phospholipid transport system substrate-binding protein
MSVKSLSGNLGGAESLARRFSAWLRMGLAAIAIMIVVLGAAMLPGNARAADNAEDFVQASIVRGNAILNDPALSAEQRQTRFRDFVTTISDTRRIALFTLGPYARDASPADLGSFASVFTDFLADAFATYNGRSVKVVGSTQRSDDDAIVNAEVLDSAGKPPLKIAFRVRKNEGGKNVVTDIQVEGAWLAVSQRADFTSFLQQHGGDIAQLSKALEERVARLRLAHEQKAARS